MARKKIKEKLSSFVDFSLDDVVQFPVDLINFHEDFQPRSKISQALVDRYSENLHDQFLEDNELSMPPVEILCVINEDESIVPIADETEAGKAIATNKKVEGKAKPKAGDLGYVEVLDDKAIEIVDDNLAFWLDEVVQVLYKKFADEVSLRHLG